MESSAALVSPASRLSEPYFIAYIMYARVSSDRALSGEESAHFLPMAEYSAAEAESAPDALSASRSTLIMSEDSARDRYIFRQRALSGR